MGYKAMGIAVVLGVSMFVAVKYVAAACACVDCACKACGC